MFMVCEFASITPACKLRMKNNYALMDRPQQDLFLTSSVFLFTCQTAKLSVLFYP